MTAPAPEPRILCDFLPEQQMVRITLQGAVSCDRMEQFMQEIDHDPRYERNMNALIDMRPFAGDLTPSDMRRLAGLVRQNPGSPGARRAVVVSDEMLFELTRTFESLTFFAPVVYHVFRDERTALAWLQEKGPRPSGASDR